MTFRYLLDTSTISAPMAKRPDPAVVRRLHEHAMECTIAAPVWHELTYGCRRLSKSKRRSALEAYLQEVVRESFAILAYDEAAAAWHGQERARLEAALGRPAPFVDGQIASIAHTHGLTLVTSNTTDFAGFKGLRVEDWSTKGPR